MKFYTVVIVFFVLFLCGQRPVPGSSDNKIPASCTNKAIRPWFSPLSTFVIWVFSLFANVNSNNKLSFSQR